MDLRKLEMFRLVAHRGSVRLAASEMGLTVPAISTQIRKLERELKVELFHHQPNKLVLTAQGQAFLRETARVFEALDRAAAVVSGKQGRAASAVSLTLSTDILAIFAPRIAAFSRGHPETNISIRSRSSFSGLSQVMDNETDLCIGFFKNVPQGIHKIGIVKTGITLVHSPNRKIEHRKKLGLKDIARHRLALLRPSSSTRRMMDAAFAARGIVPRDVIEVTSCQTAMNLVGMDLAVGLVHSICAGSLASGGLVQLDASHCFESFEVALVVRTETLASGIHHPLIEALTAPWP
jgi:DNA-binding transcriptional LysR family regulator